MYKVLITVVLAASLVGCTHTGTGSGSTADTVRDVVDNAIPFLRPGVGIACNIALSKATSGNDRIEKAKIINSISNCVAQLAGGACPTQADVEAAIASIAPDKAHWSTLMMSISDLYQHAYSVYIKGDAARASEVLRQICLGCQDATAPYL